MINILLLTLGISFVLYIGSVIDKKEIRQVVYASSFTVALLYLTLVNVIDSSWYKSKLSNQTVNELTQTKVATIAELEIPTFPLKILSFEPELATSFCVDFISNSFYEFKVAGYMVKSSHSSTDLGPLSKSSLVSSCEKEDYKYYFELVPMT